jgi:ADP-ribose pyrophosphatase YjhB (NUDIX family)
VGVAGIVLNERGEVLLARHVYRAKNPWGPPGGIIHHREDLTRALYREILEETQLEVEVGPLLQVGVGEQWPHVTFHFMCAIEGAPQPQVSDELFEARFFPPGALPGALEPVQEAALAYALDLWHNPDQPALTRVVEME